MTTPTDAARRLLAGPRSYRDGTHSEQADVRTVAEAVLSVPLVYPSPKSPPLEHAKAILQCVTKTSDSGYERDVEKPCFGLMEPYELAVFVAAITDDVPLDEAWLRSVGCKIPGDADDQLAAVLLEEPNCFFVNLGAGTCLATLDRRTRGQLRLLAMALGVTIRE